MLGLNICQPLLHMSKIFIYINGTEKRMNQFEILYMVNPTLHVNKVFIYQVYKCLRETFHPSKMPGIRNVIKK